MYYDYILFKEIEGYCSITMMEDGRKLPHREISPIPLDDITFIKDNLKMEYNDKYDMIEIRRKDGGSVSFTKRYVSPSDFKIIIG